MTPRRLIVFARLPVFGRVKTRLAAVVGAPRALDAHRRLLAATLRTARAAQVGEREFRFDAGEGAPAPGRASTLCARLAARGWSVAPQRGADLGARMHHALAAALSRGEHAVLVGCDCPVLTPADVDEAFDTLEDADAVFLPAEDGGYALVGLSRPLPVLFDAMPWGTAQVMAATLERSRAAGVRSVTLRTVWDVDVASDLARWDALRGQAPR